MALKKDGNSKRSTSYMPYDSSDSFVKKITNKVTGLVGWRSQSQSSVISQNYDNLSNSTDEDNVSPTPKRIRMQCEEEDTLLRLRPSTSKGANELCSPIQPISNNIKSESTNNRNKCFISSTPGDYLSSTVVQPNPKHQTPDSSKKDILQSLSLRLNMTDSLDNNEFENISLTIPQFSVHRRHNVTIPASSKDVPSQTSNLDANKRTSSFTIPKSRGPSFNFDLFMSNRNANTLSPFYSARTIYGGAAALLPYADPSSNRLRSASTSKLNLFSPRSRRITIQPVSPSPNKCANDQETMSASARKILDTLEKYCSPVRDAKRIPVNEVSRTSFSGPTSQPTPSRGVKRKLPTLSQMTPSTTDLLRIKRREKMQDSVSSARQVVNTVLESTIAVEDSDSDSVDLDYSIRKGDTDATNSQKYIGKTRRKDEKKFDYEPLPPLKLPNVKLNITSLPKFDITDTFTFSKPLLLENLEQNVTEENGGGESIAVNAVPKNDSSSQTSHDTITIVPSTTSDDNKFRQSTKSSVPSSSESTSVVTPQFLVKPLPSNWTTNSLETKTPPWTCKVCLLESTGERCSSCTSTRIENKKSPELPKPPSDKVDAALTPTTLTSGWGDKFRPATNSWECKECFVRNASTASKCAACASPKPGTSGPPVDVVSTTSAPAVTFSFGFNKTCDTTDSATAGNAIGTKNPLADGLPSKSETEKSDFRKSVPVFNDVFGSTNNVKKTTSMFETASANKENGDDKGVGNNGSGNLFNSIVSFGSESSPKKKNIVFPNYSSPSVTPSVFGSNGFAKSETSSPFTSSNPTSVVGSLATSVFSGSSSSSALPKLTTNDAQATPAFTLSFGVVPSKAESINAIDGDKGSKLFANTNAFDASSMQQQQLQPSNNSVFGSGITSPISAKSTNNIQATPSFGTVPNKVESINANDDNKGFKLFASTPSFGASSMQQQQQQQQQQQLQQPSSNSVFGSRISSPASSKLTDDIQTTTPSFGVVTNKSDSINANADNKSFKLFANTTNFGASSMQQPQQQPLSNSVFGSSIFSSAAAAKPTNDIQATPSFGEIANKTESSNANDVGKGSKLFASTNSFGVSSMQQQQQQQQPLNNSIFGSFGGEKVESQTTSNAPTFNATPVFNFGSNSTTAAVVNQQPASGGFTFNGPKAEDKGASKFLFGGTTNANYATNSSSSMPTFGNAVFGGALPAAPSPTMNAAKKPGGFSFPTPSQFGSQAVNNFAGFGNATTENQDQNRLNSNATSGTTPYVFGSANLAVPLTFNFTGGNPSPTFSAQPAAINNTASTGLPQRRIKKAARRIANNKYA